MPSPDDRLTIGEVAELLGVSRGRADQYVRDGRLPVEWVGPIRVCRRADVAALKKMIRPRGRPKGGK